MLAYQNQLKKRWKRVLLGLLILAILTYQAYLLVRFESDSAVEFKPLSSQESDSLDNINLNPILDSGNESASVNGPRVPKEAIISKVYAKIYGDPELRAFFTEETSLQKKCSKFFDLQEKIDPDWKISNILMDFYSREAHDFALFLKKKKEVYLDNAVKKLYKDEGESDFHRDLKKKKIKAKTQLPNDFLSTVEKDFEKARVDSKLLEQQMVDGLNIIRVFGKCYLGEESKQCDSLEPRMFDWLSGFAPKFERFDGTTYQSYEEVGETLKQVNPKNGEFHVSDRQYTFEENNIDLNSAYRDAPEKAFDRKFPEPSGKRDPCFVTNLHKNLYGRGIVVSASDEHVNDLVNLIRTLRALGSLLPIQIVHMDELSEESKKKIVSAGRDRVEAPPSYEAVKNLVPSTFPEQEIWFVDISPCYQLGLHGKFQKYATKLSALFFNSFSEMILMDLDTVPLVDPSDLFVSKQYKSTGTYFFKDRELFEKQGSGDAAFFKRIVPTDLDEAFFGFQKLSEEMRNSRFFKFGYIHLMEAGTVPMDRKRHFTGLITMMQLNLFEPIAERVWGDKELYWLGLALSGDQDFLFNKDAAYVVGELLPKELKFSYSSMFQDEICSTHPGHLNESGHLLWINSGFKNCKHLDCYSSDSSSRAFSRIFGSKGFTGTTLKKYMKYYNNLPTRITAALLPSVDLKKFQRSIGASDESLLTDPEAFYNNNLLDVKYERMWRRKDECKGYLYCGYVGRVEKLITETLQDPSRGYNFVDESFHSKIVEFDNESTLISAYLGDVWVGNYIDGYVLPDKNA